MPGEEVVDVINPDHLYYVGEQLYLWLPGNKSRAIDDAKFIGSKGFLAKFMLTDGSTVEVVPNF